MITVVGPRASTKSSYIAMVIDVLKKPSIDFEWSQTALSDNMAWHYRGAYYDPLFKDHCPLGATGSC